MTTHNKTQVGVTRLALIERISQVASQLAAGNGRAATDYRCNLAYHPVLADTQPGNHDPLVHQLMAVGRHQCNFLRDP
ncbi:hypothetical protein BPORC_1829 [Bifidobacterium porcinum]|nr:hypothetical protein BPORC_1829 [Bifidobacterium porcinum]